MPGRGRASFTKRQKERSRQEKQREKAERKTQRKQETQETGSIDQNMDDVDFSAVADQLALPNTVREE